MISLTKTLEWAAAALSATLVLGAGSALAQPAGPPSAPTTRILAIGRVTPKFTPAALRTVLPEEVRDTVKLYLQGRISDWYARNDRPGVVFILNTADPKEAQQLLATLPLDREGLMEFDLIPIGPLAPLGLLLNGSPGAPG
jgi:hypothetical protein